MHAEITTLTTAIYLRQQYVSDGSTVFSANKKWGFFPSFSAAWRVSEEAFMKDIHWISNFKVRLGWGTVGNDNIPNYLSLDLYEANKIWFR